MGSQKCPSHETSFINRHFPADTVGKTYAVALEGVALDYADAMQAWGAEAETGRVERFDLDE